MQGKGHKPVSPKNISKHDEPAEDSKSMRGTIMEKNDEIKVILSNLFQTKTEQSNVRHRIEKKKNENEYDTKRDIHCN